MRTFVGYDTDAFEEVWQEQLLLFARTQAWSWLTRWNHASACRLNHEDLEDILSEVLIAVLNFKIPEGAVDWKPCFMGYLKRVAHRIYCRFRSRRSKELLLEDIPPERLPQVSMDSLNDSGYVQAVADGLMAMPRHHALAFLLHLEADLVETILEVGGTPLHSHLGWGTLPSSSVQTPMRDREIAQILNLTPRAVIRARQLARQRLRTYMEHLVNLGG